MVVVSHVSPIKAAVAWAVGAGDDAAWRMFCDVASISRIRTTDARPTLVTFNETAHLAVVSAEQRRQPFGQSFVVATSSL